MTRILPPVIVFAFFTAHVVACGGEPAPPESAPAAATTASSPDAVAVDGSSATKKELGVTRWTVTSKSDGSLVEGFDAKDEKIVELASTATSSDGTHDHYRYDFHSPKGDAKLEIAIEKHDDDSGVLTMLANSFADNPDAKRALELMQQDFEAKGSQGTGLLTKSLQPEDTALQQHCADLIRCGQTKLVRLDADAKAALICGGSAINVGAGVIFDSATGHDPQAGAAARAGDCARAMQYSQDKAAESAQACRIDCIQL